jgi:hypothetical protein
MSAQIHRDGSAQRGIGFAIVGVQRRVVAHGTDVRKICTTCSKGSAAISFVNGGARRLRVLQDSQMACSQQGRRTAPRARELQMLQRSFTGISSGSGRSLCSRQRNIAKEEEGAVAYSHACCVVAMMAKAHGCSGKKVCRECNEELRRKGERRRRKRCRRQLRRIECSMFRRRGLWWRKPKIRSCRVSWSSLVGDGGVDDFAVETRKCVDAINLPGSESNPSTLRLNVEWNATEDS